MQFLLFSITIRFSSKLHARQIQSFSNQGNSSFQFYNTFRQIKFQELVVNGQNENKPLRSSIMFYWIQTENIWAFVISAFKTLGSHMTGQ